jgi:hypothetical protein
MALLNVGDVVASVAALLDDPGQTNIDQDYVIPFINLRWANLIVNLSMLGLQYSEETAIINLPAGATNLTQYMASGQPLASLMMPLGIDWKLQGDPDTEYEPADSVRELDDLPPDSTGIPQYAWQGGTVLISTSSVPVTIRIRFNAMSTTLVDPTDTMIRGVGDIIAYRAAELLAAVRGMPALKADMRLYGDTALDDFITAGVLRSQSQFYQIPPTHRRNNRSGVTVTLAPSIEQ